MKKISIILIIVLSFSINLLAQKGNNNYSTAVGIKFYPTALSIKHFIRDDAAVELLGYIWNKGTRITALYEIHNDWNIIDGLQWYYGPGIHVGFYNNKYNGGTGIGIDGVLGLDYKFANHPINISVDWQPAFEFGNTAGNGFSGNWGGIGIRYVIK
jgi:hypothetical protein